MPFVGETYQFQTFLGLPGFAFAAMTSQPRHTMYATRDKDIRSCRRDCLFKRET